MWFTNILIKNNTICHKFWKTRVIFGMHLIAAGKFPSKKPLSSGEKKQATILILCSLQVTPSSLSRAFLQLTVPDKERSFRLLHQMPINWIALTQKLIKIHNRIFVVWKTLPSETTTAIWGTDHWEIEKVPQFYLTFLKAIKSQ